MLITNGCIFVDIKEGENEISSAGYCDINEDHEHDDVTALKIGVLDGMLPDYTMSLNVHHRHSNHSPFILCINRMVAVILGRTVLSISNFLQINCYNFLAPIMGIEATLGGCIIMGEIEIIIIEDGIKKNRIILDDAVYDYKVENGKVVVFFDENKAHSFEYRFDHLGG